MQHDFDLDKVVQNNVYYALEIVLGCLALHGMHVVASKVSMRSLLHHTLDQVSQSAYCHMLFGPAHLIAEYSDSIYTRVYVVIDSKEQYS